MNEELINETMETVEPIEEVEAIETEANPCDFDGQEEIVTDEETSGVGAGIAVICGLVVAGGVALYFGVKNGVKAIKEHRDAKNSGEKKMKSAPRRAAEEFRKACRENSEIRAAEKLARKIDKKVAKAEKLKAQLDEAEAEEVESGKVTPVKALKDKIKK